MSDATISNALDRRVLGGLRGYLSAACALSLAAMFLPKGNAKA